MGEKIVAANRTTGKLIYVEIMRIIAILFVVFNHTGNDGFFFFKFYTAGGLRFWALLFESIFCKFAVPLFFAISGAMLLKKEKEPLSVLWRKRISKIAVVLLLVSVVYAVQSQWSVKEFLIHLYQDRACYHLWYLYAYLAMLVGVPFLRAMVNHMEDKLFRYMIVVALVLNSVPIFEYLCWQGQYTLHSNLKPTWIAANIVLYPCVGYYLEHRVDIEKARKELPFLWIINLVGIALCMYATFRRGCDMGEFAEGKSQTFYNNYVVLNCIAIYLTVKCAAAGRSFSRSIERAVNWLGKGTFCVYLFHLLFMRMELFIQIRQAILNTAIHQVIGIWIYIFIVVFVCYLLYAVLSRLPVIKNLI